MKNFDKWRDPIAARQEDEVGTVHLTEADVKKIKQKAASEGRDPEAAVIKEAERIRKANGLLRIKQAEDALRNLEEQSEKFGQKS